MRSISSAAIRLATVGALSVSGIAGAGLAQAANGARAHPLTHRVQAGPALLPAGHSWTVTLVTGDVVHVTTTARGRPPLVAITPRPGRGRIFFTKFVDTKGDVEVVPSDVAPLIGRVLDPALFNVTTLIQNGDDDAHRAALPLIIQGHPSGLAALPGLARGPGLPSIGAVAATESRPAAVKVGRALAAMASAVVRAGLVRPQATGGISHIWLDRTIHLTDAVSARVLAALAAGRTVLDHNLVQIGAPVAWRAGDTGRGIKVAVLDTGVDATFPDLRGQIAAERNFTSKQAGAVDDRLGHGTFVAALIAGTGRAADGARRGVAFGARLVIGKVLNDQGSGTESQAIAGMQWAATRARIVNISFGAGPSAGFDPQSEAINHLTTVDHVLFVAAAGNDGPGDETVEAPASAKAALAVGAVDGRDRLVSFSSRGPVLTSFAIKPEVTAPGLSITGARASGTSLGLPIDPSYTVGSGTSFAAPEVAGAAAILAGLHPAWSPARLKADIVAAAAPVTGGDFYEVGGGRVDIGAEIFDPVTATTAIADLGATGTGAKLVRTNVAWGNTSRHAVRLELSVRLTQRFGPRAPSRAFGLTATSVVVPANGTASAGLVVRPRRLTGGPGLYEGVVVARDGKTKIRTPVSLYVRPPTHTLIVRATALPGTTPSNFYAFGSIFDVSDPDFVAQFPVTFTWPAGKVKEVKLTVPDGHYWIMGVLEDNGPSGRQAIAGYPEVNITRNTSLVLDGASAAPVTAAVSGRPTMAQNEGVHVERAFAGQVDGLDEAYYPGLSGPPITTPPLFVRFSGAAHTGTFRVYSWFRLSNLSGAAPYFAYDLYHPINPANPATDAYPVTPAEQAKLAKVTVHFYGIDGNTALVQDSRYGLTPTGFLAVQNVGASVPGGSTRTDYVSTGPQILWDDEAVPPLTVNGQNMQGFWVTEVPGFFPYRPGSQHVLDWVRQPFVPGPYSATKFSPSDCTPVPTTRVRTYIQVDLVVLQDLPDGFDCFGSGGNPTTMHLYIGNRLDTDGHPRFGLFRVPVKAETYRLTFTDDMSKILTVSTKTSTTWTFRSGAPAGSAQVRIPLLVVRYHLPLGLLNHPDGSTAILTVTRVAGTPRAAVTGFRMWTSVDGGKTWQLAADHALGAGRYAVTMPPVSAGQGVSLRVQASDAGGSKIDQTIITAYHG